MGAVRFDGREHFEVLLESSEDWAALTAALRATPGSDAGERVGENVW